MPYNTAPIAPREEVTGQVQLPMARVKKIIAIDTEIAMCSNNAAFVITLATEMFIQNLVEQGYNVVKSEKKPRRNIQYRDLANAVARHDAFEFLSDIVPRTVPFKVFKARAKARGNPLPGAAVEVGQTKLGDKSLATSGNGTYGMGLDKSVEMVDDDPGAADPNKQLEMEIRSSGTSGGLVERVNGTGKNDESFNEDVKMS